MNPAEIKRFLQAVRPPGRGYLFTLKKKRPKQTAFASNHAAEGSIFKAISQREDVFVSLAQFREDSPKREGAFAEHFASVWVDIDVECGDGACAGLGTDSDAASTEFRRSVGHTREVARNALGPRDS